jgi:hypothetical protein
VSRHRSPRSHEFIRLIAALVAFTVFVVVVKVAESGVLPWLLGTGVLLLACRRWRWHRRAAAWLREASTPKDLPGPSTAGPRYRAGEFHQDPPQPEVLQGQVVGETEDLRRQVAKLEADAAKHEQLVDDLEDAAGRSIHAVIASYRAIQSKYGSAAVGKPGRQP